MAVKPRTTYEQQLDKIKKRGCIVGNDEYALKMLSQVNYYRLSAYFLVFKKDNDTYKEGTTFERVCKIYEFDRKLRNLIFTELEAIEIMVRTKIAYYFSHTYGPMGYLDSENFSLEHKHASFIDKCKKAIEDNRNQMFVKHHLEEKNSEFPIWVLVELLSFGTMSIFYADMKTADKKRVSEMITGNKNDYVNIESWLTCLCHLRNWCAHYSRLYFNKFGTQPRTPNGSPWLYNDRLFGYLMAMKLIYPDKEYWDNIFVCNIESLIEEYSEYIEVKHLGCPSNWKRLIRYNVNIG